MLVKRRIIGHGPRASSSKRRVLLFAASLIGACPGCGWTRSEHRWKFTGHVRKNSSLGSDSDRDGLVPFAGLRVHSWPRWSCGWLRPETGTRGFTSAGAPDRTVEWRILFGTNCPAGVQPATSASRGQYPNVGYVPLGDPAPTEQQMTPTTMVDGGANGNNLIIRLNFL